MPHLPLAPQLDFSGQDHNMSIWYSLKIFKILWGLRLEEAKIQISARHLAPFGMTF
jgi:hypothetical protein